MALTVPNLDNLSFQQIVDHAKKLIPRYCPEWTDHNVSDPGITLIELFASMTEMLLYRVNQVPDKMYITFLNLLGIRLQEARAAQAPVTFYLSTYDLQAALPVQPGTEVATIRTEADQAIVFTTETDLVIRPPVLMPDKEIYIYSVADGWRPIALRRKEALGEPIDIFPASLAPGDAFCLALKDDHSHNMLALRLEVANAGGSGVNPLHPPRCWEVWHQESGSYQKCDIDEDGTHGFNENGEVVLHLPAMSKQEVGPDRDQAFLLYCRLTEDQADRNRNYKQSPRLLHLHVEVRGGTAQARQAVVVRNETLGQSDGTPGQTFKLKHAPLLARRPEGERLVVKLLDETIEIWQEVQDFANSGPGDRHYTLDSQDGTLTFGPLLPQPNGEAYCFGAIPPPGSTLIFSQYQYGGGVYGNVPRGSIRVLKSAIPFVTRVANRRDAIGGLNAQLLEDAKLRAPRQLRDRTRAVTKEDFEELARQYVPEVAAAYCLAPNAQPGKPTDPPPGQIVMVILPTLSDKAMAHSTEPIPEEALRLHKNVRDEVRQQLEKRSLLGTKLLVREPRYIQVVIEAEVRLQERSSPEQRAAAKQQIERLLYGYLNPYTGGPGGKGWPFGRSLHNAEIRGLLQQYIEGIEFIEQLDLRANDLYEPGIPQAMGMRVAVPEDGVICSGKHRVSVS